MAEKKTLLQHLADLQDEMLEIEIIKSTEAYGYKYVELDNIIDIVLPVMRKHKIGYYHLTDYDVQLGKNIVETVIYNIEDESQFKTSRSIVDDAVSLAKMNRFMVEGSAITYYRRYHLVAMLGLTTEKDTDAGGMRKAPAGDKQKTTAGPAQNNNAGPDYVGIFKNLVKNKSETVARKSFEKYKPQISNDDINKIEKVFTEAYGNN